MNLFKRTTASKLAFTVVLIPLAATSPAQAQTSYDTQQQAIKQHMYRYGSCPKGQQPTMMFETEDFYATICYDQASNYTYNGHEKGTTNHISLPAIPDPDTYCGEAWGAVNDDYLYVITTEVLGVVKNGTVIFGQPVIDVYAPYWDRC